MWAESGLQPSSWSTLRSLAQLTILRVVMGRQEDDGHLQHIAAAAPCRTCSLGPLGASSIASLRSLASLHLVCPAEGGAQLACALAALPRLTHLGLAPQKDCSSELPQLMQALGQLTGLCSLQLDGRAFDEAGLAPLEALQRLTSLCMGAPLCGLQDAAVLARLGALRTLDATFDGPAAVAAAGLHRLQGVTTMIWDLQAEAGAPIQLAAGSHIRLSSWKDLRCFDASQVHVLEMHDHADVHVADRVLPGAAQLPCPQLRGLQLCSALALDSRVLQVVAACSHLTSLRLGERRLGQVLAAAGGGPAALAQGCSRLRRLALQGVK
jgi:hypothetical protein